MGNRSISWVILLALAAVWGSSFILMKKGMIAFSSDEVAALRIGIAFIVLTPFYFRHPPAGIRLHWKGLLVMGVFGNLIPAFLFTMAETRISSSLAGMLNALTPIFAVIVSRLWLKIKPSGAKISGVVIGFISAICLIYFDSGASAFSNFSYGFLILLATICYAISINGIRKYLSGISSVAATVWAFSLTGPVALIYLFSATSFTTHLSESASAASSLGYVMILAVVGTAISVILFNVLIKRAGVLFASSCTYLIPIAAIIWGLSDGEIVNFAQILSMVAVIFSVYLINRQ
jgi:drug/metabolite transporter (DMT)-like permease